MELTGFSQPGASFLKCTTYFRVLFGEEVNKRESSVGTSPRHLLRQPQCFDFSKCTTKRRKFKLIYHCSLFPSSRAAQGSLRFTIFSVSQDC